MKQPKTKNNMTKFKEGDWVFAGMELKQIKKISDDWISLTCGQFESSSSQFDMFHLDIGIKRISDYFMHNYDKLHSDTLRPNSLNFPDICRHFESKWAEACEAFSNGHPKESEELCKQINEFTRNTIEALQGIRTQSVDGVNLFR